MNLTVSTALQRSLRALSFLFLLGLLSFNVQAQPDGEKLFKGNCASCHSPGANQLVGPGLAGVSEKYEREWLYAWIKNSQALIAAGDADAIAVYEQYNKVLMPAQAVNDEEIDAILAYIDAWVPPAPKGGEEVTAVTGVEPVDEPTPFWLVILIVVVLLAVVGSLRGVLYSLNVALAEKNNSDAPSESNMWEGLLMWINRNKRIVGIIGIVLLAMVAKAGWDAALGVGVYEGYEPEQPIKFSHKLHAGENGIDCKYCHNSVTYSKSAGIPPANLCMNCHTYIQEGPQYGKEEIGKIYAALDFDPVTKTYGPNQKPIKWVKVHNLPDHVYFNHSQHVVVGKVACQKCHGPVEEYTVGKQHAPLTMGWCINCHRETKVQTEGNGYYDEIHARLPEDLKEQYLKDGTITVSELGGLECAKCHY